MDNIINEESISTGKRLKELIMEKKLTQEQFAEEFNTQTKTVSEWVNNKGVIRKSNLAKIANFFDVDVEYLTCDQLEKRKSLKNASAKEIGEKWADDHNLKQAILDHKQWSRLQDYLEYLGVTIQLIEKDLETDVAINQVLIDKQIITFREVFSFATSYEVEVGIKDRGSVIVSESELKAIIENVNDFIMFKFQRLLKNITDDKT